MRRSVTLKILALPMMAPVTSDLPAIKSLRRWAKGKPQIELTIPLNPVPASRPRVSQHVGVYYLKTYSTWMKQAALHLPQGEPAFPSGRVIALAEHFVQRPKTTRLSAPRGDVDNYLKATLDAVTKCKAVWSDDDQVALVIGTKQFTVEDPHTQILVVSLA
jgi:Holliday junction resolvase RusA-like endonuclease